MTRGELTELCLTFPGSMEDYPFKDDDYSVVRHSPKGKWFALIFTLNGRLAVNLKCDPMKADFWRQSYSDCIPGWHMNKRHWNTVFPMGDVPLEALEVMIEDSFNLTKK